MAEQFRGHPGFDYTAQVRHLYDQSSFDQAYESMPLEPFEPMLRRGAEAVDLQARGRLRRPSPAPLVPAQAGMSGAMG